MSKKDEGTAIERFIKYIRYDEQLQTQEYPMQLADEAAEEYIKLRAKMNEARRVIELVPGFIVSASLHKSIDAWLKASPGETK